MNRTDESMRRRGWTRIVGVAEKSATVLIYAPAGDDEPERICIAVAGPREVVVVSARLHAAALQELVQSVTRDRLRFGRELRPSEL